MNQALVNRIVNAVLYEGYLLYPYRPSVKNRHRWTFGGLYPQAYSEGQRGSDAWSMQTECLVLGGRRATLAVTVRFLHLQARLVGELTPPLEELPADGEPALRVVEALPVGGRLYQTWQEAVEREVNLGEFILHDLADRPQQREFAFFASRRREPLREPDGKIVGLLMREQQAVQGSVELSAEPAGDGLFKARVTIRNRTPLSGAGQGGRDDALLRALVSTHTILGVRDSEFVSLLDPPESLRDVAAGCRNVGTWPVLVGEAGAKDTILSSPIILYDYPQIAPESPGDLFDSLEIDEILSLRILTLTDEEKRAMAAVDERARALLQRTESLAREQLLGLHGVVQVATEGSHE